MKILFILANDFPYSGSCTSLMSNLMSTEAFLSSDHQFSVLSLGRKTMEDSVEKINNIDVYRTYLRSNISKQECSKIMLRKPWQVLCTLLYKVYAKISCRCMKRAINSLEVMEIVNKLNKIGLEQFDVIVPMFANLCIAAAALQIKKKNPRKKVVLYQVDPCSSNEEYPASMRKELSEFEEELFSVSDWIITTGILLREAREKYPSQMTCKMTAMEFPNIIPKQERQHVDISNEIKCLFTGNIYSNIRNPEYTFRLFHQLDNKINLELIGFLPDIEKAQSEKYGMIAHGLKTLQETRAEIEKASILVNIGNSMLNQVPSKLFEYISYGKPIVNICKNRDCPTLPYLEHYPYALNLFEEEALLDDQRAKLYHFIKENYNKRVSFDWIRKEYESSTPQYCATQMICVFDEISHEDAQ